MSNQICQILICRNLICRSLKCWKLWMPKVEIVEILKCQIVESSKCLKLKMLKSLSPCSVPFSAGHGYTAVHHVILTNLECTWTAVGHVFGPWIDQVHIWWAFLLCSASGTAELDHPTTIYLHIGTPSERHWHFAPYSCLMELVFSQWS